MSSPFYCRPPVKGESERSERGGSIFKTNPPFASLTPPLTGGRREDGRG